MAFEFSLAVVLRLRESIEKREERALQSLQLDVSRTLHAIEELSVAIGGAQQARERALQQAISGGHLHSLLWEEQLAEQGLRSLLGRLQVLEQAREKQIKVYQAAHRDREMLSDMMEKQKDIYEREWLREEQKQLDDIFIARRHRVS
jgi:flagellar export protein FliJ